MFVDFEKNCSKLNRLRLTVGKNYLVKNCEVKKRAAIEIFSIRFRCRILCVQKLVKLSIIICERQTYCSTFTAKLRKKMILVKSSLQFFKSLGLIQLNHFHESKVLIKILSCDLKSASNQLDNRNQLDRWRYFTPLAFLLLIATFLHNKILNTFLKSIFRKILETV